MITNDFRETPHGRLRLSERIAALTAEQKTALTCASAELLMPLDEKARAVIGYPHGADVRRALDDAWSSATPALSYPQLVGLVPDDDDPDWTPARAIIENSTAAVAFAVASASEFEARASELAALQIIDAAEFYQQLQASDQTAEEIWASALVTQAFELVDALVTASAYESREQLRVRSTEAGPVFSAQFGLRKG